MAEKTEREGFVSWTTGYDLWQGKDVTRPTTLYAERCCTECEGIHPTSGQAGFYCDGDGGMRREVIVDYEAALGERRHWFPHATKTEAEIMVRAIIAAALGEDVE